MSVPTVITAPTIYPVSLSEAKDQLRVSGTDDEDALIDLYIEAATEWYEGQTSRATYEQTLEHILGVFPASDTIFLPRATPLQSITSLKYKDSDGTETTWAAGNYIANTDSIPGALTRAYGISWPSFTPYPVSPIRIRYVAGMTSTSPISEAPAALKIPIMLLIGGLFENRENVVVSDRGAVSQIAILCGAQAYMNLASHYYGMTQFEF